MTLERAWEIYNKADRLSKELEELGADNAEAESLALAAYLNAKKIEEQITK